MLRKTPRRSQLRRTIAMLVQAILVLLVTFPFATRWNMILMPDNNCQAASQAMASDEEIETLAEELRGHVVHLAEEIGERNVGRKPEALAESADYIEECFTESGYDVQRQEYNIGSVVCTNVIAEIEGGELRDEIVVIGAHYDSVYRCPAANDNGSGVAATLVLARLFASRETKRTLRFVAFTNEEGPYFKTERMGSRVYASACKERDENIVGMFSLETIGYYDDEPGSQDYPPPLDRFYPDEGNFIAFIGNMKSRKLVQGSIDIFEESEPFPCEGGVFPELLPGVGNSDHSSFWMEGYQALMVTDTAPYRYPYYHTPSDTPDKIDFDRTAQVVRGLDAVASRLAGVIEE